MPSSMMLTPTLHIEVLLSTKVPANIALLSQQVKAEVSEYLKETYAQVQVGTRIADYDHMKSFSFIERVDVVDYTGPPSATGWHNVDDVQLDVVAYALKSDNEARPRRRISQDADPDEPPQARVLPLPNVALKDEWDSLIYDEALPSQLLRYLTRMLSVMKQPGLNLSTFNWNRLCLLHGPPGSGKSTLCRALAQKLSIRLSRVFPHAVLVEVNTNSMLSKYFGESGKLIANLFDKIHSIAQTPTTLVCVIMDEVETIASSREKASNGGECSDSVRATNQLLTALDRLRALPNIIVLCTSNLISAIVSLILTTYLMHNSLIHIYRTQPSSTASTSNNSSHPPLHQQSTTSSAPASTSSSAQV